MMRFFVVTQEITKRLERRQCITYANALMLWKTCADDVHMVWSACGNTRDEKKYLPTLQRFPHDRAIVHPPSHVVSLDAMCPIRKMRPARPLLQPQRLSGNPPRGRIHDRNCRDSHGPLVRRCTLVVRRTGLPFLRRGRT